MSTSLRTQIHLEILALFNPASPYEGGVEGRLAKIATLTNGTGTGQADIPYLADLSLTSGGNSVIDVRGSVNNAFGSSVSMAKVLLVAIQNDATVDGYDLMAGPDATNGWGAAGYVQDVSDRRRINAGGVDIWYDPNGIASVAGASDELYIENLGAGTITGKILIIGRSA
jgi:hypothetical protein